MKNSKTACLIAILVIGTFSFGCKKKTPKDGPNPSPTASASPGGSPDPVEDICPAESNRGWGFLFAKRGKNTICGDHTECLHTRLRVGDQIALDSTPRTKTDCPPDRSLCVLPEGCLSPSTVWDTAGLPFDVEDEFSITVDAVSAGTFSVSACPPADAPGTCTTKLLVIDP